MKERRVGVVLNSVHKDEIKTDPARDELLNDKYKEKEPAGEMVKLSFLSKFEEVESKICKYQDVTLDALNLVD